MGRHAELASEIGRRHLLADVQAPCQVAQAELVDILGDIPDQEHQLGGDHLRQGDPQLVDTGV